MKGFFGSHPSQDLNFRRLSFISLFVFSFVCERWVGVNVERVTLGLRGQQLGVWSSDSLFITDNGF